MSSWLPACLHVGMKTCKHRVADVRKVALDGRKLGRLDVARWPPNLQRRDLCLTCGFVPLRFVCPLRYLRRLWDRSRYRHDVFFKFRCLGYPSLPSGSSLDWEKLRRLEPHLRPAVLEA